jgi:AhpC/TSA family.
MDVYMYGATAEDSAAAAEIMTGLGFTNVHYLPGVGAWSDALVRPDLVLGDLKTVDIYGNAVNSTLIADKKLVMVNVWATYCNPCISEMEGLGKIYRQLRGQGIMIVGLLSDCSNADLSVNEAQTETARLIAESTKADYPHILPSKTIYRNVLSQIQAVPTTFFVDSAGNMVGRVYVGSRDADAWKEIILSTLASLQ